MFKWAHFGSRASKGLVKEAGNGGDGAGQKMMQFSFHRVHFEHGLVRFNSCWPVLIQISPRYNLYSLEYILGSDLLNFMPLRW